MYVLDMTKTLSKGESVPFIAGAPLNVSYYEVPGYDVFPGNELGSTFDFQCDLNTDVSDFESGGGELDVMNGGDGTETITAENTAPQLNYNSSATFGCMISGSRTVVADVCTALGDKCQAFDYYEKGFDPTGLLGGTLGSVPFEGPVGVLKTGDIAGSFTSMLDLNPNSIVYVKSGVLPESSSSLAGGTPELGDGIGLNADEEESNNGGSNTVVIVVVSVIVGIFICLGLLVMFYYIKRYQQMTKAFPSPPNSPGGSRGTATPQVGLSPGPYPKSGPFYEAASVPHMNLEGVNKTSFSLDESSDELTTNSLDRAGSETPPSARHLRHILNNGSGFQNNNLNGSVVVTEVPLPSGDALAANAGRPGSTPVSATGASARDLMDAFSQMYMKRPAVDYATIGSLKEDEEAEAVKELEAAVAAVQSRRLEQSGKSEGSTKIPSLIRNEATGLEHAGLGDDWSILPEEVEVCRRPDGTWWQLGTGGFGTVYRGLYHGIHPVAIKIIHHIEEDRHKDSFIREASLLKALRHRNVVQFLGASLDGPQGTALLVTELMELGDLWRALPAKDDNEERIFGWYLRGAQCVSDVANGLHYLHTKRVVHFDLKSANILLEDCDFDKEVKSGVTLCLRNSGQSCNSPTRLLVPQAMMADVAARAKQVAESLEVGSPRDTETQLGPVVSERQWDKIQGYIRSGIEQGATLVTGGPGRPGSAAAVGGGDEPGRLVQRGPEPRRVGDGPAVAGRQQPAGPGDGGGSAGPAPGGRTGAARDVPAVGGVHRLGCFVGVERTGRGRWGAGCGGLLCALTVRRV